MADELNGEMSTVIDRVLDFIQRRGRATISEIAVALALSPAQVEKMATMLEESGVINVRYALIDSGKTELIAKETRDSGTIEKIKRDEERMKELASVISTDIEKLETSCSTIEHDISRWLVEAGETLSEMGATKDGNGGTTTAITQADELEKMAKQFEIRVKEINDKVSGETRSINGRFTKFYGKVKEFKANAYKTPYKAGKGGKGNTLGKLKGLFGGKK